MPDLSRAAALIPPWRQDPWGKVRPQVSPTAMMLSARLASDVYDMNVEPWQDAGWRDVTIQLDGEIIPVEPAPGGMLAQWGAARKLARIRARLRQRSPLGQMADAIRLRKSSSTGKALVMLRPALPGRYVVAISFMGTGMRWYDWISNLRMDAEDGVHRGYQLLARQFEDAETEIAFPETARELGCASLTLRDILREAASPDSRFVLWLCGHSQGGALMQIYAHRKLTCDGVRPANMVGYSFASPSAFSRLGVKDPSAYPLYHLINSEDVVPRMGAQVHLGMCLYYAADDELRSTCYTWPADPAALRRRALLREVLDDAPDLSACLEVLIACAVELRGCDMEELLEGMQKDAWRQSLTMMLAVADEHVDALLLRLAGRMAQAHISVTGRCINGRSVRRRREQIARVLEQMTLKEFFAAWAELLGQPHRINRRGSQPLSPYAFLADMGRGKLRPGAWYPGLPAQALSPRLMGDPFYAAPQPLLLIRRRMPALRRSLRTQRGPRRLQDSRLLREPRRRRTAQSTKE